MMAMRSDVDKRARRYASKQCVADYGMHKDASTQESVERIVSMRTLRDELDSLAVLRSSAFQDWFDE